MHPLRFKKATLTHILANLICMIGISFPNYGKAQIEMIHTGSYSQNFDILISSGSAAWTDTSTISGWYWQYQIQDQYKTYSATDGTDVSSGKKSFGLTGNSDRAMGIVPDKIYPFTMGLTLQNKSSTTISQVSISYTGEQWLNGGYSSPQPLLFGYRIVSTLDPIFTSKSGWTTVADLHFNSPKYGSPSTILNGNLPENSTIFKDISLSGISIPPNSYLQIRWHKETTTNKSHDLAIDDVTIKWVVPVIPTLSVSPKSLTGLNRIQDSIVSIPKQYILSGEDLPTGGNPIVITAPINYEISLDNQLFSSNCSLSYSTPILSPQKVYVRLASSAKAGNYSNDLITHSIGGVLLSTIPISGSVYKINWIENFEGGTQTENSTE